MAEQIWILSNEEYNELLNAQQEPSKRLRETNQRLAKQYDELKACKAEEVIKTFTSPFKVKDNILEFCTKADFVAFFNYMASKQGVIKPSLMKTDAMVFDRLQDICLPWDFEMPFKDIKVLKSYRVSLVKSGMYILNNNNTQYRQITHE